MVPGFAYAQHVEKFKGFAWQILPVSEETIRESQSTGYVTNIDGVPCVVFCAPDLRLWAQPVTSVKGARYSEGKTDG